MMLEVLNINNHTNREKNPLNPLQVSKLRMMQLTESNYYGIMSIKQIKPDILGPINFF